MKVGHVLQCLVCGVETRVDSVPLSQIQEVSVRAQTLLCDQLEWREGMKVEWITSSSQHCTYHRPNFVFQAVKDCQTLFDKHLVPPSLEYYNTQISIWRALWMIVGNKKYKKSIL